MTGWYVAAGPHATQSSVTPLVEVIGDLWKIWSQILVVGLDRDRSER